MEPSRKKLVGLLWMGITTKIINDSSERVLFFMSLKNHHAQFFDPKIRNEKHLSRELFCTAMPKKVSNLRSIIRPSLHNILSLMLSGNVHTNPGPSICYRNLCQKVSQNLKFFHLNVQNKLPSANSLVNDVGVNTIFGFSETWLTQSDDHSLWSIDASKFQYYLWDRSTINKKVKVLAFLPVPNSLVSLGKRDLKNSSRQLFDSPWIEFKSKDQSITFLVSLNYCPAKIQWNNTKKKLKKALVEQIL